MKNFTKFSILPIVGLLLAISAILFNEFAYQTDNYRIPGNEVQLTLVKKQKQIKNLLGNVSNVLSSIPNPDILTLDKLQNNPLKNSESLEESGFSIFVYKNNELRVWSDNKVMMPETVDKNFESKLYKINSGYYVVEKLTNNDFTIIGLILIKHNYKYENKYLENSFQPDFNLPSFVRIIEFSLSYSYQINDLDGNYLFSLVPEATKRIQLARQAIIVGLFISGFLLFLLGIGIAIRRIRKITLRRSLFIISSLIILALRGFMIIYKQPVSLYELTLFGTDLYAASYWFNSLGDFILNCFTIIYILIGLLNYSLIGKFASIVTRSNVFLKSGITIIAVLSILPIFYLFTGAFESLLLDSDLNFKIYLADELNTYSLFGFGAATLIFWIFTYAVLRIIQFLKLVQSPKSAIKYILFLFLPALVILYFAGIIHNFVSCLFLFVFVIVLVYLEIKNKAYSFYQYALIGILTAAYVAVFISAKLTVKEEGFLKVNIAKKIAERDPYLEHRLNQTAALLPADLELTALCANPDSININSIGKYLNETYFTSFWTRFNIAVDFTPNNEAVIKSSTLNKFSYLPESEYTTIDSSLFFKDNYDGSYTYLKTVQIAGLQQQITISVQSGLGLNQAGFPEQLFSEYDINERPFSKKLSFAKYFNGHLVKKAGIYPYRLTDYAYAEHKDRQFFVKENGYKHLIYRTDNQTTLILSNETGDIWNIITAFTYYFVYINMLMFIYFGFKHFPQMVRNFQFNFKSKIITLMVSVLVLSFGLVGIGTAWFEILKYNNKLQNEISDKINSITTELQKSNLFYIEKDSLNRNHEEINKYLVNLSSVFSTEINLYATNGKLIAGSNNEVFDKGLKNKLLQPNAYIALANTGLSKFSHNEKIGNLNYLSIYAPLTDERNNILAYVNLPYFTKSESINNEISAMIVAVINLYVFLFLISLFIALFISDKITHPLHILESKFKNVELGKSYEEIQYHGNDEIGNLVKVYNQLVGELNESVELLARSERESAWREMAKQIAHEIKNPLTPMKLSVQFLQLSWRKKDDRFEETLNNVTQTITEQIDTLSTIATEFSNFAKMPRANNEIINMVPIIESIVRLFENTEKTEVCLNLNNLTEALIFADKEQMDRVFINLIKNAIQAMPKGKDGTVKVDLFANSKIVRIKIEDNGTGISEELKDKLFRPNFTTKNSGMGMGLAIVKNIVENAAGVIWFETEVGKGTRFFVEFPNTTQRPHNANELLQFSK